MNYGRCAGRSSKKKLVDALNKIKHIEVRHIGTGVVIFTASVPLVIGDEITPKCLEVESVIPKGYELELGKQDSHAIQFTGFPARLHSRNEKLSRWSL